MTRFEKVAIALVPAIALATVALALRTGASSRVVAARVYAGPAARGRAGLALQLVTVAEEGNLMELTKLRSLEVIAVKGAKRAEWHGASSSEGVAEAWLALDGLHAGDDVELSVRAPEGGQLAQGAFKVPAAEGDGAARGIRALPAKRRSGDLSLDVFVDGETLVPESPTRVALRAREGATAKPSHGVTLQAEAGPGLQIDAAFPPTNEDGWTEATVTAEFLTAEWTLTATGPGTAAGSGTWFGSLPVTPGAASVDLPAIVPSSRELALSLTVPPASPRLYVQVVDASGGYDFATALDLSSVDGGHAKSVLPPFAPGLYWLVTSADPAAEAHVGTTVRRPFRVPDGSSPGQASTELARLSPPGTRRGLVLDGLREPRRRAAQVRARALFIALGALAVATVLEALLIFRAAGQTKRRMGRLTEAALGVGIERLEAPGGDRRAAQRVALLVLVTLLGFAVVALLLLDRAP